MPISVYSGPRARSRTLYVGPCLAAVLAACLGCGSSHQAPVNVLLVSFDTMRADRLNCYGYERRRTSPEIDDLAADGILFERHITASPWTTPSHLSLLTGLYPSAHGVTASYKDIMSARRGNLETGQHAQLSQAHVTLAEALEVAGWSTAAFTGGVTLDPSIGFSQGFQSYDTSSFKLDEARVEMMLDWIEGRPPGPFFLFWHTFEVHGPYVKTDFLTDVLEAPIAGEVAKDLGEVARVSENRAASGREVLERHGVLTPDVVGALYDGGIRSASRWLGVVLDRLRALDLYDETLIIVTSDHGEHLGERPGSYYNRHGDTVYGELIRIPLIVKLPGQRFAGMRVAALTRSVDVMPTVLDVAGPGADTAPGQGVSLVPTWERQTSGPEAALSESTAGSPEHKALVTDRYKYVVTVRPETVRKRGRAFLPRRLARAELYDLLQDRDERVDLIKTGAADKSLVAQLDATLRGLVTQRPGRADAATIDAELLKKLKALGYVE